MRQQRGDFQSIRKGLLFGGLVVLTLLIMTAFWLQNAIFNTSIFTNLTTQAFSQPSSRESIGELVADRVFEDRPALKSVLSQRLSGLVSGALATDPAQNIINRVARDTQLLFTSPVRDPVVIQLTGVKSVIVSAQQLTGRTDENATLNANDIPDEVMLIDTARLPNFHGYSLATLWVGYLALATLLASVSWWLYRGGTANLPLRIRYVSFALLAAALIALATGPLVEPAFVSVGRDAASQTLLRNIYESFIGPFRNQALILGGIAALAILLTVLWEKVFRAYSVKVIVKKK